MRGDASVGGNVQWLQHKLMCPNCVSEQADVAAGGSYSTTNTDGSYCCDPANIPEGKQCMPDTDNDNLTGCVRWRIITGLDETALPAEMGLVKAFDVDSDGIP